MWRKQERFVHFHKAARCFYPMYAIVTQQAHDVNTTRIDVDATS